jgi:hypothetical protein
MSCSLNYINDDVSLAPLVRGFSEYEYYVVKKLFEELEDKHITGSVIEFGVFNGGALEKLVSLCEELKTNRQIYGFDSFEGLPAPRSGSDYDCFYEGQFAASLEDVSRQLRGNERPYLHLIKGWFADTLWEDPAASVQTVAYARIDCDLYQPCVECLDWLSARLVDEAVLVFDDWGFNLDMGETKAFYEWEKHNHDTFSFDLIYYGMLGHLYLKVHRK